MVQRYERLPLQNPATASAAASNNNDDDDDDHLLFDRQSFDDVQLVASHPSTSATTHSSASVALLTVDASSSSSSSSSTSTTTTVPFSSTSAPAAHPLGTGTDGVFSNLNPNDPSLTANAAFEKNFDEIEPPSYQDAVFDATPPYFDATVVSSFSDDGDVIVEDMMMMVGFILMVRANADFVRVQRLRAVVLATSEHNPV
ncbi:hypothetical protein HDU67_000976 [Dinochytrium kinnereticum]|nr:hypothetical protein HDU67_000976 [Dinochytrium kinnereticum]